MTKEEDARIRVGAHVISPERGRFPLHEGVIIAVNTYTWDITIDWERYGPVHYTSSDWGMCSRATGWYVTDPEGGG